MPVIKSAIKKLRRDRKREKVNDEFRKKLDRAVKDAKRKKTQTQVKAATSLVDRAVKNNLIHKNRAARMKSSLSKLAKPQTSAKKAPAKNPAAGKSAVKKKPQSKTTKK